METLYVTTMIAIFVLCLALLSTARRILRSSPLSSGELSLSRMYDMRTPENDSATFSPEEVTESEDPRSDFALTTHAAEKVGAVESWMTAPLISETLVAESSFAEPRSSHDFETENSVAESGAKKPGMTSSVASESAKEDHAMAHTVHPETASVAEEVAEQPIGARRGKKSVRVRKQLPHSYSYVLECLLLGVSLVVLVKTQRSNSRNRALESSQHRVA